LFHPCLQACRHQDDQFRQTGRNSGRLCQRAAFYDIAGILHCTLPSNPSHVLIKEHLPIHVDKIPNEPQRMLPEHLVQTGNAFIASTVLQYRIAAVPAATLPLQQYPCQKTNNSLLRHLVGREVE
jgi:hypothetical protein